MIFFQRLGPSADPYIVTPRISVTTYMFGHGAKAEIILVIFLKRRSPIPFTSRCLVILSTSYMIQPRAEQT